MTEKCDLCPDDAFVLCKWGAYDNRKEPMNESILCSECSNTLYDSMKGAINAGFIHWVNKPINKL